MTAFYVPHCTIPSSETLYHRIITCDAVNLPQSHITQLQKVCHKVTKLTSGSTFIVWNASGCGFSSSSVSVTSSPFIPTPHFSSSNDIRLVSLHEPESLLSKFTQFWKNITVSISWLRKFRKMVWIVKNWNYKTEISGKVGTYSDGFFVCGGLT